MALKKGSVVPQCNIVTRMPFTTIALLCKQTTDNFRSRHPPELPYCAIYQVTGYYFFLIISLFEISLFSDQDTKFTYVIIVAQNLDVVVSTDIKLTFICDTANPNVAQIQTASTSTVTR